jgi:triosephosphate isomerase
VAASRRPIIIGNWKMHKNVAESVDVVVALRDALSGRDDIEVGVAPPFTALAAVAEQAKSSKLLVAAQNCHAEPSGAFTGEIAVPMLKDVGCTHVIIGHSERRQYFGETDESVNAKVKATLSHGLTPVVCIGERLEQREQDQTFDVVGEQLTGGLADLSPADAARTVLAYEPVWAIGTGRTASNDQAQEVHAFLRARLGKIFGSETADVIRIQYGGSVKPGNASGLMAQPDIDGALVGGASLEADSFLGILNYER